MRALLFAAISFLCLSIASQAAETMSTTPSAPSAAPAHEDVQTCLDRLRKEDFDRQARLAPPPKAGEPKTSPYTYSKVEAKDLPTTCAGGDLATMKQALKNQIENCKMASPQKAVAAMKAICEGPHPKAWCSDHNQRKAFVDRLRNEQGPAYNTTTNFTIACRSVSRKEWCLETNERMLKLANESKDFDAFLAKAHDQFDWYKNDGKLEDEKETKFKKGDVQFTAYDTPPALPASLKATDQFKTPIYRRPPNLIKMADTPGASCGNDALTGVAYAWCLKNPNGTYSPAPTRKEIEDDHALKNDSLIVGYVKDPVDLAFLMVQGSGSISMNTPSGNKTVRVNFDGQNGRARYMLARIVRCDGGAREDWSSEQGIRKYLQAHSDRVDTLLHYDQSYVFLRAEDKGPFGAEGVVISGRHSFATDPTVVPLGAVTMFNMHRGFAPNCNDMTSMAIAQDTGGAIRGAHVDWYTGDGAEAQTLAGNVNETGSLFAAMPKGAGHAVPNCQR